MHWSVNFPKLIKIFFYRTHSNACFSLGKLGVMNTFLRTFRHIQGSHHSKHLQKVSFLFIYSDHIWNTQNVDSLIPLIFFSLTGQSNLTIKSIKNILQCFLVRATISTSIFKFKISQNSQGNTCAENTLPTNYQA